MENQNIEWKESWRSEYLKWICGFANAQGGELVIGKSDRGEVVGIDNARKLLEAIPNQVRDLMGILVDVDLYLRDGLDYLVIKVEPYPLSGQPQGGLSLSERQHQAGTQRCGAGPFSLAKAGETLGRRARAPCCSDGSG